MDKTFVRSAGPDGIVGIGGAATTKGEPFTVDESCVTDQIKLEFNITEFSAKKSIKKGA